MEAWIIWGIIALLTLVIEIFTTGIAVICFSVGAVGAMVAALFGGNIIAQVIAFAGISILALILLRPIIIRWIERNADNRSCATNTDALVGRQAVVSQTFVMGDGRVSVDGDDWKAICEDQNAHFEKGQRVEIVAVNSVILTIKSR